MGALGIIPFLFFCAAAWQQAQKGMPLRDAVIRSGVIAGLWAAAGAELLSLIHALTFWPVLVWWSIPTIIMVTKCVGGPRLPIGPLPDDIVARLALGAGGVLLAITFAVSALTPPNVADAQTYHLTRQVYWIQQQSVANFPTSNWRALAMPPLAEFAGVQAMILSGGDRWVNLITWLAFALTAVTASAMARDLGCNERLQALAALLALSVPVAAMQSMNPKNDLVVAFYLCALMFQALKMRQTRNYSWPEIALLAAACGLLVLTKGTGMIFAVPLVVWIAVMFLSQMKVRRALVCGALTGSIILLINTGHFVRTCAEFGSVLGPDMADLSVANRVHTPAAILSNLLRNTAMHLTSPSPPVNGALYRMVETFHGWIELDLHDPRTTYTRSPRFSIDLFRGNQNRAKAPVHMLLAMAAFIPILRDLFRSHDKLLAAYFLIPYAGFALFCWLLAWQDWHARLHVPLFASAAPAIVHALGKPWPRVVAVCTALAFALALFSVLTMQSKPLTGESSFVKRGARALRYMGMDEARPGLRVLTDLCRQRKPKTVGVFTAGEREYVLLWNLLNGDFPRPRLIHVEPKYGKHCPLPEPEMIVAWLVNPTPTTNFFSDQFVQFTNAGLVQIYVPR